MKEWPDRLQPHGYPKPSAGTALERRPRHPEDRAVYRAGGASASVLRTDPNGWIELATDGESIWVEVEKK